MFLGQKICCPIIFVRTAVLDSQPNQSQSQWSWIIWCSEAFHRTMLQ